MFETLRLQFQQRPYASMAALLLLLVGISFLPLLTFSLSIDPILLDGGVTAQTRAGIAPGFPTIDPNAGITTQALGKLAADQWLTGQIPWWNPYSGVGLPLAAEMQCSSLFLPFVLLLHFGKGVLYLRVVMQILAGLATFALLRQVGLGRFAAILGGVLYAFNGTFAWFQHASILPLPFLPLLLLGLERTYKAVEQKRPGGWRLITLAVALSLYSGFPETAYMNGLLAVGWTLVRVTSLSAAGRLTFLAKSAGAYVLALLLAAPVLVPFFQYLSYSGAPHSSFKNGANPPSSFLQLLLPYVLGPLEGFIGSDPKNELIIDWGNIGGYFGLTTVFLAIVGCCRGQQEKLLRWMLGVWTFLVVARSVGAPGTISLFYLMPAIDLVAVSRYGLPACEMAIVILAAFALEEWQKHGFGSRARLLLGIAVTTGLVALGFWLSGPIIGRLLTGAHHYATWLNWSVALAALFLAATFLLCCRTPTIRQQWRLAIVLATEAVFLFAIPNLSGFRRAVLDPGPVRFLQSHLGLNRFYSMGPIHPNYGAFYQVASINYNQLPVSDIWIRHIQQSLDPGADPVTFAGDFPPPQGDRDGAVRTNMQAFEDVGVQYVVAAPGRDPFQEKVTLSHAATGNIPSNLEPGESMSGVLPPTLAKGGRVDSVGTVIGRYGGKSLGLLQIQLCAASGCAMGRRSLKDAPENVTFTVPLDSALPVTPGESLRFTLTRLDGQYPFAIWIWPTDRPGFVTNLPGQKTSAMQPEITLGFGGAAQPTKLVYQSPSATIYELARPAPYFQTNSGDCTVQVLSRTRVALNCREPATLLRRELFYPGWKVSLNGQKKMSVRQRSIFQSVAVPAGHSDVQFSYAPTNIGLACGGALLGALLLLPQAWGRRFVRRQT